MIIDAVCETIFCADEKYCGAVVTGALKLGMLLLEEIDIRKNGAVAL